MSDDDEYAELLKFCKRQCQHPRGPLDSDAYYEALKRLDCIVPLALWPMWIMDNFSSTEFIGNVTRMSLWYFLKGNYGGVLSDAALIKDLRATLTHKLRDGDALNHMFVGLPNHTRTATGQNKTYYNATLGYFLTIKGNVVCQSTPRSVQNAKLDEDERRLFMSVYTASDEAGTGTLHKRARRFDNSGVTSGTTVDTKQKKKAAYSM